MTLFTPPQGLGKPFILETRIIGSGFPEENDMAALIIGPTGVALGVGGDTLYVADSVGNRIAAISNASFRNSSAGTGKTVSANGSLMTPLGLTLAPNGDILTANGGDGNLVETTAQGTQVATTLLAPAGGGALFGLAVMPGAGGIYFVDDSENQLNLFH